MVNNLYELDVGKSPSTVLIADLNIWHKRLAHIDLPVIKSMRSSETVTSLDICEVKRTGLSCTGCVLGKGHRSPIPEHRARKTKPALELPHSDANGPLEVPSLGGSRDFVTFVDDLSRWIVAYPMKRKPKHSNVSRNATSTP